MARTDNLRNFCIDIANAIRAKLGITDDIPANEFDTKIGEIKTGGKDWTKSIGNAVCWIPHNVNTQNGQYIDFYVIGNNAITYEVLEDIPANKVAFKIHTENVSGEYDISIYEKENTARKVKLSVYPTGEDFVIVYPFSISQGKTMRIYLQESSGYDFECMISTINMSE